MKTAMNHLSGIDAAFLHPESPEMPMHVGSRHVPDLPEDRKNLSSKPLPLALREARAWGIKEKLFERVLPLLAGHQLAPLLEAASVCDGFVKGLKHSDWPQAPWDALRRLVLMALQPAQHSAPLRGPALHA